jgi:sugar phosphate isomerase/epimerase
MRPADATRLPEGRAVTVPLAICRGVKSDPIEYRYSYEWLFRLMAEEGAPCLQLGSFFELYRLPDKWFLELREQAERYGIAIRSAFTAHRELGGFFRDEPGWESVARRSYERLIEVAALVGARHVGSNPGAVLRDQMHLKPQGIARYLRHMKELMHFAHARGIERLTIEPMSCLAEPPTLPEEIRDMAEELSAFHRDHPDTADFGYCADVSHGYADRDGKVRHSNIELLEAALPYLVELHVKNTDALYNATFGFTEAERERGIVDLPALRDYLQANASRIPVKELVAYLEIGGPKTGRDYTDCRLESMLRESLRHMRSVFSSGTGTDRD